MGGMGGMDHVSDHFRRPGQPNDPAFVAPDALREVADAVWSLDWLAVTGRIPSTIATSNYRRVLRRSLESA